MPVTLDMMEYPDDPTIQEVYKSNGHHAIAFHGTAQLDTAQKVFGLSALLVDGDSDYLTLADSPDWTLSGDFTIDLQVRFNALAAHRQFAGQGAGTSYWGFWWDSSNRLTFGALSAGSWLILIRADWTPSTNTWYHVRLVKSGDTWYMFIDGISQTVSLETGAYDCTIPDYSGSLYIGSNTEASSLMNGWLDEFRLSQGIARSTSNFTPSTAPYQTDQYTKLLLHFDGADEATSTIDGSRLEAYSESTIVQEGTYSLKGFAKGTDALNDYLTRIVSPTINLADITKIKPGIYASRTGSNIKVGIRDSGGQVAEITPNITSANTWQTVEWDISGVSNPNKDAIDRIVVTIVNADSDNIFYLDNIFANWWSKTFTEQMVLSDSFSRRWNIYRTFTETLHLTDTVSKKIGKTFSEVITLTDTIKKKIGKIFTEQITLTDTFSRIWHIYRTFTESITLTDTISKKVSKIFTETLHLQDTFSRVWTIYRTFTEKINLVDKVKVAKVNLVNLIKKLIQLMDIRRW